MKVTRVVMYVVTDNQTDGDDLFDRMINGEFDINDTPDYVMGMFSVAHAVETFNVPRTSGQDLNDSDTIERIQNQVVAMFEGKEGVELHWLDRRSK
jgi:hypothetical protein